MGAKRSHGIGCVLVVSDGIETSAVDLLRMWIVVERHKQCPPRTDEYAAIVLHVGHVSDATVGLCHAVRRTNAHVPILVVAEQILQEQRLQLLRADVDDCVTGECGEEELAERVCRAVRRIASLRERRIEVGKIVVDEVQRRAYVGDMAIRLTSKEYALLRHLAKHAHSPIVKSELRVAIWRAHEPLESNVIEVLIGRLRKKLGPAAGQLRTLRRRGYVLTSTGDATAVAEEPTTADGVGDGEDSSGSPMEPTSPHVTAYAADLT